VLIAVSVLILVGLALRERLRRIRVCGAEKKAKEGDYEGELIFFNVAFLQGFLKQVRCTR